MQKIFCIDCDEQITLSARPNLGQRIVCPHCGTELEVIGVDPIELDWAYDMSWDEDEDEYDDKDDW
jgi:alpha-aminoadipate carrier protein LysW